MSLSGKIRLRGMKALGMPAISITDDELFEWADRIAELEAGKVVVSLPDCMMPDGGEACIAYHESIKRIAELEAELDEVKRAFKEERSDRLRLQERIMELEEEIDK